METVLITGGTGMIGSALSEALMDKGYEVIVLTRNTKTAPHKNFGYAEWNIHQQTIDENAVKKADYIIHLAGANVGEKRWTAKRKKEIIDSRVKSGQLLAKALKEITNNVQAVVSASAIGWYGENKSEAPFVETDPAANDFLGSTCRKWEAAIQDVSQLGKRLVILRTGIVLSNQAGAYAELKKTLKFGVAAILGKGQQVISWIHIDDVVNMYIAAIENQSMHGVYNAVAPHPVSNKEFIVQIARQRKQFFVPVHVPAVALKTLLGEMSEEVLKSANVSSAKIESTGFRFRYSAIEHAVEQLED